MDAVVTCDWSANAIQPSHSGIRAALGKLEGLAVASVNASVCTRHKHQDTD